MEHFWDCLFQLMKHGTNTLHVAFIQSIWKVFRPLDFFHILLHYSLIFKLIKLFFSPINLNTIAHNEKAKKKKKFKPKKKKTEYPKKIMLT